MVKKFSSIKNVSTWATVIIFVFFVSTCMVVKTKVIPPQQVNDKDKVVGLVKINGERISLKSPNSGVLTPDAMEVKRLVPAEKEVVLEKSKIKKIMKNPAGKIAKIIYSDGIIYMVLKVVSEDNERITISMPSAALERVKIPWADIQSLIVKRKQKSLWLTLLAIGVPVGLLVVTTVYIVSIIRATISWGNA